MMRELTLMSGRQLAVCGEGRKRRLCRGCGKCFETGAGRGRESRAERKARLIAQPGYASALVNSRDDAQLHQLLRLESRQEADEQPAPGKARICQHCAAHNETGTGAGTCKFALDERAIKPRLERDESGKETCNFFDAKNAGVSSHAVYNG